MARPLNELKEKKEWIWNKEYQRAFKELKDKITSQPVLFLPKREGKFKVKIDTSGYAIRRVLFQEQEGKWKPIVFLSRTIQSVERNYEIYDKELWKCYCYKLKPLELGKRTNSCIRVNTRELNKEPFTK